VAEPRSGPRANSFGSVAEDYDRYRPGPPPAAIEWILASADGIAVDLAAGTGALTRVLADRVEQVIAVEPDDHMLEVLKRRSPRTPAIQSWAERLPLRSESVDVVTISSAWHWMDPELATKEITRVLRRGGVLGVIWNGADRSVGWVQALLGTRDPSPGDQGTPDSRHLFELPAGAPFVEVDHCDIAWTLAMTRGELVGLAGTYSSTITMNPVQRSRELERVRHVAGEIVSDHVIPVPMRCRCWRAVRG
jgi:SAM-dependent methyltransferase